MYCWGNCENSELGLTEDTEDRQTNPKFNQFFEYKGLKQIASGPSHSLFLLDDGTVYSSGNNEFGQLGRSGNSPQPRQILALDAQFIEQVGVGRFYSASLSRTGNLFIWGSVTGRSDKELAFTRPTHIKPSSSDTRFVQISCGYHFLLALADDGKVFSIGLNDFGQLGLESINNSNELKQIKCIDGLPVFQVACGAFHSLILTVSGFIFSFGKNENGQLGLGDTEGRGLPCLIKSLNGFKVK